MMVAAIAYHKLNQATKDAVSVQTPSRKILNAEDFKYGRAKLRLGSEEVTYWVRSGSSSRPINSA